MYIYIYVYIHTYTSNMIDSVRHILLYECSVSLRRKILKVILTVATVVARNANEAMVAPVVGFDGVSVWWKTGTRQSVLCLYV
jgi:hypothetical protein